MIAASDALPGTPAGVATDERALRWSVALVWLATGVLVVHPAYRASGIPYLVQLGLGSWVMPVTCAGEIVLALLLFLRPQSGWLVLAQLGLISAFTAILVGLDPMLLVHPYGVLSKNMPLVAVLVTAWLLVREGWTARACMLLRAGVAVIWISEGILPKILFQQPVELAIVASLGIGPEHAGDVLRMTGVLQALSGAAALLLSGRLLRWLLWAQAVALLALPALVTVHDPAAWVHPFGPLTKNIPILTGTLVLVRSCSSPS